MYTRDKSSLHSVITVLRYSEFDYVFTFTIEFYIFIFLYVFMLLSVLSFQFEKSL